MKGPTPQTQSRRKACSSTETNVPNSFHEFMHTTKLTRWFALTSLPIVTDCACYTQRLFDGSCNPCAWNEYEAIPSGKCLPCPSNSYSIRSSCLTCEDHLLASPTGCLPNPQIELAELSQFSSKKRATIQNCSTSENTVCQVNCLPGRYQLDGNCIPCPHNHILQNNSCVFCPLGASGIQLTSNGTHCLSHISDAEPKEWCDSPATVIVDRQEYSLAGLKIAKYGLELSFDTECANVNITYNELSESPRVEVTNYEAFADSRDSIFIYSESILKRESGSQQGKQHTRGQGETFRLRFRRDPDLRAAFKDEEMGFEVRRIAKCRMGDCIIKT